MTNSIAPQAGQTSADSKLPMPLVAQGRAIDQLLALKRLRNDAELARFLGVTAATVSKIRAGKLPVSPSILLLLHERFSIPVAELRKLLRGN